LTTTKEAKHQCPKCDRMFVSRTGLGSHLRTHGINGTSKTSIAAKAKKAATDRLQCPDCPRDFKNKMGLAIHRSAAHNPQSNRRNKLANIPPTILVSNGHHPEEAHREGYTDAIPDALIAVTSGRFIELCRSVAHEHDLPPRMFAARVAAFIYGTTVR
jgi:ribosomal protein L37AE/L43A